MCSSLFKGKRWKRPVRPFSLFARGCTLVSILSTLQHNRGGGGSFHFQLVTSHWKESFAGIQHFSSPLLMKPLMYYSLRDLFQQMHTRGGPLPAHPRGHRAAPLHAEAPSGVSSPRTGSQGLAHCTVKPSQRLLIRHCSEPADNRGTCPLLRFWNESATPAHAEADA